MIVLVGGEKGGTGKSTVATTLAAMARRRGRDAALIDADVQGTSHIWAEERSERGKAARVVCFQKQGRSFMGDVEDLAERYEDLVIDAGGRDSRELRSALVICDRFLTPMQPSHADAWTLERLEDLLGQVEALRGALCGSVVLSRAYADPRIPETEEAIALLAEYERLRFSEVVLRERIAFRRALGLGLSVEEMSSPDEKATSETKALYDHAFG
jgi:chromosome partitioning protein